MLRSVAKRPEFRFSARIFPATRTPASAFLSKSCTECLRTFEAPSLRVPHLDVNKRTKPLHSVDVRNTYVNLSYSNNHTNNNGDRE